MANIWAIVQARMGSSRLPGKVLLPLGNSSILGFMVNRLKLSKTLNGIMIATSTMIQDDSIEAECTRLDIPCVRGDESDVLSRYGKAIESCNPGFVVRLTSDCPLIDPAILDLVVQFALETKADYTGNNVNRTGLPRGTDVEVAPADVLLQARRDTTDPYDREHVMSYLYRNPKLFKCVFPTFPTHLQRPNYRLCVDTIEDYNLVTKIVANLGTPFTWKLNRIIEYLDANPEVARLNNTITQKEGYL